MTENKSYLLPITVWNSFFNSKPFAWLSPFFSDSDTLKLVLCSIGLLAYKWNIYHCFWVCIQALLAIESFHNASSGSMVGSQRKSFRMINIASHMYDWSSWTKHVLTGFRNYLNEYKHTVTTSFTFSNNGILKPYNCDPSLLKQNPLQIQKDWSYKFVE